MTGPWQTESSKALVPWCSMAEKVQISIAEVQYCAVHKLAIHLDPHYVTYPITTGYSLSTMPQIKAPRQYHTVSKSQRGPQVSIWKCMRWWGSSLHLRLKLGIRPLLCVLGLPPSARLLDDALVLRRLLVAPGGTRRSTVRQITPPTAAFHPSFHPPDQPHRVARRKVHVLSLIHI